MCVRVRVCARARACVCVCVCAETCCEHVMSAALAARRHQLSVLHPSFSLLRGLRASLRRSLPPDAHRGASGRLCVSLTRASDGQNLLVTQFDSREELIQVAVEQIKYLIALMSKFNQSHCD